MNTTIQIIYFDPDDEEFDGRGWNMVDNESIASRYATMFAAIAAAEQMGLHYTVISKSICTPEYNLHVCRAVAAAINEWANMPCANCGSAVDHSGMHIHSMSYNCDGEG